MKNRLTAALFVAAALSIGAADEARSQGPAAGNAVTGRLLVTGSTTMAPLVTAISKRFQALNPGISIEVQSGGSGRGLTDVRHGKADIGMVSRALGEAEQDVRGLPIARDGVAIVVHRDNPVRALSDAQVTDIYAGKITNWRQVGGRDAPIMSVAADAGRGASELFEQYFRLSGGTLKPQRVLGDNPQRINALVNNSDAIIYTSVGEAERNALAGVPIKLLSTGGVVATSRNVRNGNFPLSRPLTLVTRGWPTGLAKAFIEYCASSQVTDLIVAYNFVPYLD